MSVFSKHWKKRTRQENEYTSSITEGFEITDTTNEMACKPIHCIKGYVPKLLDIEYDGFVCDCARILYYKEMCTCPNNPHYELHSKPNE